MKFAVAIILDRGCDRFIVQRKDDTYSRPRAIALFGGAIDTDESDDHAIERELIEELGLSTYETLRSAGLQRLGWVGAFSVFEIVVDFDVIKAISEQVVFEGERAEIVHRNQLLELPWLEELVPVIEVYLDHCAGFGPSRFRT